MKPINIFIHVPRCGGSTLDTILARNGIHVRLDPEGNIMNPDIKTKVEDADWISGHFVSINTPETGKREKKYFTMLRHPVDRFISWYYYKQMGHGMGLEEFLWESHKKIGYENCNAVYRMLGKWIGTIGEATPIEWYEIGITEYFDLSLEYWKAKGYLNDISYTRQNVGKHPKKEHSKKELQLIEDVCVPDIEIYEEAKKIFFERIKKWKT